MAKLSTQKRASMSSVLFGMPLVPGQARDSNAQRASQQVNAGRMSKGTTAKIDAKANRVLKGSKP